MERTKKLFNIDSKLYQELKKMSEETKIPMSRLIDMGIELLKKKRGINNYI